MLKIVKNREPDFFREFKNKNKIKNWDDFDYNIKNELKKYMIKNEQNIDEIYFCPYCEREIKIEKSQIEHIKPKDKFPKLYDKYNNFLVGCLEKHTCGSKKGNQWDDKFINPVEENPEEYFEYDIKTGKIKVKSKDNLKLEKAEYTIKVLNLNENKLCQIRKTFILKVGGNKENLKYLKDFPTLRKYLEEKL